MMPLLSRLNMIDGASSALAQLGQEVRHFLHEQRWSLFVRYVAARRDDRQLSVG